MLRIGVILNITLVCLLLSYLIPYKLEAPEIKPYEQEFFTYVKKYCTPSKYLNPVQKITEIIDLPRQEIASCSTNGLTNVHIRYNSKYWYEDSNERRFVSLVHEFLHCYFGEGHRNDPNHFMYPSENYLHKEVVIKQLEEFLKEKCK